MLKPDGQSNLTGKGEPVQLDADQESELREAFDLFDSDGDQSIAAKELHVVMQAIGRNMDLGDVEQHIRNIKNERRAVSSNDGGDAASEEDLSLDLEEFISFISKEMQDNDSEELVEAYRKFCGNDDLSQGITRDQLKETMINYGEKRLTHEEFNLLFSEVDYDEDGVINFDDFVRMMMSR